MKMTVGRYCAMRDIRFVMWRLLANWYHLIGIRFRNEKWLDKSVWYLDQRWKMMCHVCEERGIT